MYAELVAKSGSDDFAELVMNLLNYDARSRWTPTQALQQPCLQNINAACGYPSTAVPMPAAPLSTPDSSCLSVAEDSFKVIGASDVDPDASGSPRIAPHWNPLIGRYDTLGSDLNHSSSSLYNHSAADPAPGGALLGRQARNGFNAAKMFASSGLVPTTVSSSSSSADVADSGDNIRSPRSDADDYFGGDAAMLLPADLLSELDITAGTAGHTTQEVQGFDSGAVTSVEEERSESCAEHAAMVLTLVDEDAHSNVESVEQHSSEDVSSAYQEDFDSPDESETAPAAGRVNAFKMTHGLQTIQDLPGIYMDLVRPLCQLEVGKICRCVHIALPDLTCAVTAVLLGLSALTAVLLGLGFLTAVLLGLSSLTAVLLDLSSLIAVLLGLSALTAVLPGLSSLLINTTASPLQHFYCNKYSTGHNYT